MARTVINNGDTGLAARTALNNNFTQLYARSGVAVVTGTGDDNAAIAAAIAEAGTNGTVILPYGSTFNVDRTIRPLVGQRLIGYGATIKRVNQVITTTTTTITSGTTNTFAVANGTGANFKVGQLINVYKSGYLEANGNFGTQNLTITSIVGDTITTSTAPVLQAGSPWSGTSYVVLSFDTISPASGNIIEGITFDGNKANWSYYRWETTSEIHPSAVGAMPVGATWTAQNCIFNNLPGEGIQESSVANYATVHNVFRGNTITNCNGNGIHLSGSTATQIIGNYIYNTNLNGAAMGHNGGSITVSNGVADCLIANNNFDTGRSGVGQVDSADNSPLTITGNVFRNMSTFMIEAAGPSAALADLVITGNRFFNSSAPAAAALIAVSVADTGGTITFERVTITGNEFFNAGLLVQGITNLTVSGNTFGMTYQATDTFHNAISVTRIVSGSIIGNSTRYGNAGINCGGAGNTNLTLANNTVYQPYYYGIFDVGGTNTVISGNTIQMDTNVNAGSAQGISLNGAGATVRNNNVKMAAGYCAIRINGVANCIVQANRVSVSATGKGIRIDTSSTNYLVSENQSNFAVVDTPAIAGGTRNNDVNAAW